MIKSSKTAFIKIIYSIKSAFHQKDAFYQIIKSTLIICLAATLGACVAQAGATPTFTPELLEPISVQNDTFIVQRGNVARFDQYRGVVRVHSEGLFFREANWPFAGFEVRTGQEVRQGEVLARLDTRQMEEDINLRRQRITDLQAYHAHVNGQFERRISIAQLELLSLSQQIAENENPPAYLLEQADLKRLEIQRIQLDMNQAREWQRFALSYYQTSLNEMMEQMPSAVLRAPYDGIITYRADIQDGSRIDAFAPIIYITDGESMFVEYTGATTPMIFRTSIVRGEIEGRSYDLERIILPPNEVLFFTRAGGTAPFRFDITSGDMEYLRPGQGVSMIVYQEVMEDVLRIPLNALFSDPEIGHYVHIIEGNNRILQQIESGIRSRSWIEVRSGLLEGDEILVQQ